MKSFEFEAGIGFYIGVIALIGVLVFAWWLT
jgi:hypothetical protein